MKNRFKLVHTLLVAGVVVAFASLTPVAQGALSAANQQRLASASSADVATIAASLISAATPAQREQLAKDIAAWVVVARPGQASQTIAGVCQLVSGSAPGIVAAAAAANPAKAAAVVYAVSAILKTQAPAIAAAAAQAVGTTNSTIVLAIAKAAATAAPLQADAIKTQLGAISPTLATQINEQVAAGVLAASQPANNNVQGGNVLDNSTSGS